MERGCGFSPYAGIFTEEIERRETMNHISAVGSNAGSVGTRSFNCTPGFTDICDYADFGDVCLVSDLCDYDMDDGSFCIVDACGIDQT